VRESAVNKLSQIIQKKLESLDYEGIPAFFAELLIIKNYFFSVKNNN
jgi:hypothetical protein